MWGLSKLATDGSFISRDYADTGRKRRSNFTDTLVMRPAQVCLIFERQFLELKFIIIC